MKLDNQEIYIFDNVYQSYHTQKFYNFIINSYYKVNAYDTASDDYYNKRTFGSRYSKEDLKTIGIIEHLPEKIKKEFNISLETNDRGIVNAITSNGVYHPHDDHGRGIKWSFLYYANMKWEIEWGGDTLFLNDDRQTISNTVQCKPNRVVIFDASIPHIIRPSTTIAPQYRFSVNMTFRESK